MGACGDEGETPDAGGGGKADACTPQCPANFCGSDGCGGTCSCASGMQCQAATSTCVTVCNQPETDLAFCQRHQKNCGSVAGTDLCGQPKTVSCGSCAGGVNCVANVCEGTCVGQTNQAFCAAQGKQCGPASGNDNCGVARNVAECGPCTGTATCTANGVCSGGSTGQNDTCASPDVLNIVNGTAVVTGDTTGKTNDYESTVCDPASGPDVVFKFTVAAGSTKNLKATLDSTFDGALLLRSTCTDDASQVTCADREYAGTPEELTARNLAAGEYFIIVDGYEPTDEGTFTLNVELTDPPPPPANDTCATATDLGTLTATGATDSGDASGAVDDYQGACSSSSAPHTGGDAVYKFTVSADASLTIRVAADPAATDYTPAVYLRKDTCDGTELYCDYAYGAEVNTMVNVVTPGTYYLFVDGLDGIGGPYALELTLGDPLYPPANDLCTDAIAIDISTGTGSATGDTTAATDSGPSAICGVGMGPDVVYKVTTTETKNLKFTLTMTPSSLSPIVYVLDNCGGTELACNDAANPAVAVLKNAAPGTYYVVVDAYSSDKGPFTLDVVASDPPANDSCAGTPTPLAFDTTTGVAVAAGDTSFVGHDARGSCNLGFAGDDMVYTFTLSEDKSLDVLVVPTGDMIPVVHLRKGSCDLLSAEVAGGCATPVSQADLTAHLFMPKLTAGTYYLWVDSYFDDQYGDTYPGAFDLTATLAAPAVAPANDACTSATALPAFDTTTGVATAAGDTTNATNDSTGSYYPAKGPDVVYSFTLDQPASVTAVVAPDATTPAFLPTVYIRSDCLTGFAGEVATGTFAADSAGAVTATAKAANLAAGTYFVFVDGAVYGTRYPYGKFNLTVTKGVAGNPVANDSCRSAQELTLVAGANTFQGTTAEANDDAAALCGYPGTGDVVYAVNLATAQNLTVTVAAATGSTLLPVVSIRKACDEYGFDSEISCAYQADAATPPSVTLENASGRYFIWVDGDLDPTTEAPTAGAFDMTITLDAATAAPANDSCTAPAALTTATAVTGQTTMAAANDFGRPAFSGVCDKVMLTPSLPGNDAVYTFTPATAGSYTFTLTPTTTTFDAALWVTAPVCGGEGGCLGLADSAGNGGAETLVVSLNANETYFVVVDSYLGTEKGEFTIEVH